MNQTTQIVPTVLFDFDGVVMDTESQYSLFWQQVGKKYLAIDDLHLRIKGQTLDSILHTYFNDNPTRCAEITSDVYAYERQMTFEFIPGFLDFLSELKRNRVHTAIVTSSDTKKMEAVYQSHPELPRWFDAILTSDDFSASKPDPDCFLQGMNRFGATPETTYVFEDSFNGLRAALASKATVIALATTNSRAEVSPLSHYVIDNFEGFSYDRMISIEKKL